MSGKARAANAGADSQVLPDARPASLILRLTPPAALPFVQLARLDRPIGWQLLLAPCWQSAALAGLASRTGPDLVHLALFLIGAIAMRGAGSTYNDILDRKLDAGVERTRGRPLPSGRVTLRAAAFFLVLQAFVGLAVLLCFNRYAQIVALGSLAIVAVYPLMKRVTAWPQAILGLAFSWGALMGWAALYGNLSAPAFLLYASAFSWTIGYDTIYALQDARDDAIVGIHSTARLFGAKVRLGVGLFYLGAALLAEAALLAGGGRIIAQVGLCLYGLHLAWQLRRVEGATPQMALSLFRSNRDAGLLLFAGFALDGWAARFMG